jgi:outer membrane protein with beta-barrel domain
MRLFLLLFGLAVCADAQSEMRNTITLSGGLAHSVGTEFGDSAPSVAVTYAYRLLPHVDVEAGIDTALSLGSEVRGANYDIKANDRFIWVPFGLRGVLPLRRDRVEVSVGAGGTYEKYSASDSVFLPRNGWGGYASVGAAVALDGRRHFWLDASSHLFLVNTSGRHDRWVLLNLGLGLRF